MFKDTLFPFAVYVALTGPVTRTVPSLKVFAVCPVHGEVDLQREPAGRFVGEVSKRRWRDHWRRRLGRAD